MFNLKIVSTKFHPYLLIKNGSVKKLRKCHGRRKIALLVYSATNEKDQYKKKKKKRKKKDK